MDLFAFRGKDHPGACTSTCGRANSGSLFATGDSADDRADPGAAPDDACVTSLLGVRRGRKSVRGDCDRPVVLDDIGKLETDAGPAFHSARPFRIDNASPNLRSLLKKGHSVAHNRFRQVRQKNVTG